MNWKIEQKLASGTFGTIYKVTHSRTGEVAALKLIHDSLLNERRRIKRGFIAASKVKHPNCVKMIQWIEQEKLGFVMEFVAGRPISVLKNAPLVKIIQAMIQVCNGLDALHSHQIVHRDLKPGNILITPKNIIKITDFDLIKLDTDATNLTMPETFMGTVKYASPEQCSDASRIDSRSDLYSLGVIFYELITGQLPFDGNHFTEIALAHLRSPVVSPQKIVPDLPDAIEGIIRKLLSKNPQNRFQTARQIAIDLNAFLNESDMIGLESTEGYLLPPIFAGRDEELRMLENVFTAVSRGSGKLFFIAGESGIGKTRLWQEFRLGLSLQRFPIFETQFTRQLSGYEPFRNLILKMVDSLRNRSQQEKAKIVGRLGWDLTQILPELSQMPFMKFLEKLPPLSGEASENRLFDALTNFIKNFAYAPMDSFPKGGHAHSDGSSSTPIILFFDDIQWAGEKFIKWLHYASQNFRKSPVLLMGSYRKEEILNTTLQSTLNVLQEDKRLEILELSPLPNDAISEIMSSMLAQRDPLHCLFSHKIFQQTGGNPLFVEELMRHLVETEKLKRIRGNWVVGVNSFKEFSLPKSVQTIIKKRLVNLPDHIQHLLKTASIIGKKFDLDLLMKILDEEEMEVISRLEDARAAALIEEISETDTSYSYQFLHDAIRETLEAALSPEKKRNLHRIIAEILELREHTDLLVEKLARHFYQAHVPKKAAKYCTRAGEIYEKQYFNEKAIAYYSRAIEMVAQLEDKKSEIELLQKKGGLLEIIGAWEESEKIYQQALVLSRQINDTLNIGRSQELLGTVLMNTGDYENAMSYFEEALKLYRSVDAKSDIASVLGGIGNIYSYKAELTSAMDFYKQQLKILEELEDKGGISKVLGSIGKIYLDKGDWEKSENYLKEYLKINEELNNKHEVSRATGNIGIIYSMRGAYGESIKYYQKALEIAEFVGDKQLIANWVGNLGNDYRNMGNFPAAMEYYERQLNIVESLNNKAAIALTIGNIALIHRYKGNYDFAIQQYEKALAIDEKLDNKEGIPRTLGNLANAYWAKGDFHKAIKHYDRAIEITQKTGNKFILSYLFLGKSDVLVSMGDLKNAKINIERALRIAHELGIKDFIFEGEILSARIDYELGDEQAIQRLYEMLANTEDDSQIANLNYQIWKMNASEEHRKKALDLHQKLYEKTPYIDYKSKIDELSSTQQFAGMRQDFLTMIHSLLRFINPDSASSELLAFLTEQTRADRCQIITRDAHNAFEVCAISPTLRGDDADFSRGILIQAINKEQPILIENAVEKSIYQSHSSIVGKSFLSVIVVPMRNPTSDPKIIGALYLDRRDLKKGIFTSEEMEQAQTIADILSPILIRQKELELLRTQTDVQNLGLFVGSSPKMQQLYRTIRKMAKSDATVHIFGESGSGKDLVARALHRLHPKRGTKPFISINCSAVPKDLAESELFGHEKGAFSGAHARKRGKFELANGGTLFLNEIAELSLPVQAKLLSVVEEKQVWRVGGEQVIPINVRIIAATHKDLKKEVEEGNFREDLFYRLNILRINVPSLRERGDDILLLAEHFLEQYCQTYEQTIPGFTEEAMIALKNYHWPGNVRELKTLIERAVVSYEGDYPLSAVDIFVEQPAPATFGSMEIIKLFAHLSGKTMSTLLHQVEGHIAHRALIRNRWNKTKTAEELGIGRPRLNDIINRCNLDQE